MTGNNLFKLFSVHFTLPQSFIPLFSPFELNNPFAAIIRANPIYNL